MSLTMAELDRMPDDAAGRALEACCGSRRWVDGMLSRRPFGSPAGLLAASDAASAELSPDDWLEAFAHHPRIGEQRARAAVTASASAWSAAEQSAASTAPDAIKMALADANREYEGRFGFTFIICASGRNAEEILAELESRLRNERDAELGIAADEQQQITKLRLAKLLSGGSEGGR